jgi:hypothetical protein
VLTSAGELESVDLETGEILEGQAA